MNSPAEIAANYVKIGTGKTRLSVPHMLVLGILAGAFIAFGALASQVAAASVPLASVARIVTAAVFPIGLMMVLVAGSELFTGNCLLVIPVLQKEASVSGMLRNWLFVYLGNLIGGLLVALAATYSHVYSLYDGQLAAAVVNAASAKVGLSFGDALIRGILCNVMVCIAVWVSFAAKELAGKILALALPVFLFVLCGFEHCVANMYYIPAGMMAASEYGLTAEALTMGGFLFKNLLPVTLGNIIGGAGIVGCGYWYVYLKGKH